MSIKEIIKKIPFAVRIKRAIFKHDLYVDYQNSGLQFKQKFQIYAEKNDINQKISNLKNGMDEVSCEYVDKMVDMASFAGIRKYKDKDGKRIWTKTDIEIIKKTERIKQPCAKSIMINTSIIATRYGLVNIPQDVYQSINGKNIIDVGGCNGDTALLFNMLFADSKVFVFEPVSGNVKQIQKLIKQGVLKNTTVVQKALGDKANKIKLGYNDEGLSCAKFANNENEKFDHIDTVDLITLDSFEQKANIGFIKMDTEGFETQITMGAKEIIKKQKPVLSIAIYHNPEDFFDLKDKIKTMNPEYKFMIRRSEIVNPGTELVLIAY